MFIGRETELHFLHERYQAEGGQLIILYGRRRVGKTETLREFCKGKPHVFYSCTQTTDQVQLLKFSEQIMKEGYEESLRQMSLGELDLSENTHEEYSILDKFGRVQLPENMLEAAGIEGKKVRLEVVDGNIVVKKE